MADLLRKEAIRFYPGVPYQFSVLAALPEDFPIDLGPLRLCTSSEDVLPERTYARVLVRFGHPLRALYGSPAAGSIAINTDPNVDVAFGSLDLPLQILP